MGGFLTAVARRGAVGNTARWAVSVYHRWTRLTPEDHMEMDTIFATLIATRYDVDALVRLEGDANEIRTALDTLHDAGMIRSICHVVVLILAAEADFADHHCEAQTAFIEVISAELTSAGVSCRYAFGEDLHLSAENLCLVYLPSIQLLRLLLRA